METVLLTRTDLERAFGVQLKKQRWVSQPGSLFRSSRLILVQDNTIRDSRDVIVELVGHFSTSRLFSFVTTTITRV